MPLSRHSVETYLETSSHANSSGNTRSQSSQLAEPLWTDPRLKSGIRVNKLISALKKEEEKEAQVDNELSKILKKNPRKRGKSHHHPVKAVQRSLCTRRGINECGL